MSAFATPAGFAPMQLIDPFELHVGPIFERSVNGCRRFAILIDDHHVNRRGILHGGMLATFADLTHGAVVWDATGKAPCATLGMQMQYLKSARKGDLVEVTPQLLRRTQALLFMRGDFTVAGETIFTAMSIWKLLGQD
jgi:uncharacterized protein (TIGR00369 family)